MYTVSIKRTFSAAHSLRHYMGKCEALHGHNWRVKVAVQAEELDKLGMVMDFKVLKKYTDELLEKYDHAFLNDIEPFDKINPSSENLAKVIFEELNRKVSGNGVKLAKVSVRESKGSKAVYRP